MHQKIVMPVFPKQCSPLPYYPKKPKHLPTAYMLTSHAPQLNWCGQCPKISNHLGKQSEPIKEWKVSPVRKYLRAHNKPRTAARWTLRMGKLLLLLSLLLLLLWLLLLLLWLLWLLLLFKLLLLKCYCQLQIRAVKFQVANYWLLWSYEQLNEKSIIRFQHQPTRKW